jgi:hypothetical protein
LIAVLLFAASCVALQVLVDPLQLAFSAIPDPSSMQYRPTSSGLAAAAAADSLPPNVHLLTTKWLSCNTVLIRLSHMFQAGEHPQLSQQASVQLSAVAKLLRLDVLSIQEATLFGERSLEQLDEKRPTYNYRQTLTKWQPPLALPPAGLSFTSNRLVGSISLDTRVTLNPMQIRAFFFTVQRSQGSSCTDPLPLVKPIAAGGLPAAAGAAANTGAEGSWLQGMEQKIEKTAGELVEEAAVLEAAAVQQARNITADLLRKRIDPTVARVALLSRGVLLLFLLVPASVTFGVASCFIGRSGFGRSKSISPKHTKLKGVI